MTRDTFAAKGQPVGTIEVLPPFSDDDTEWIEATITDLLSTQFTADVPEWGTQFFFYAHKGLTWRQIGE